MAALPLLRLPPASPRHLPSPPFSVSAVASSFSPLSRLKEARLGLLLSSNFSSAFAVRSTTTAGAEEDPVQILPGPRTRLIAQNIPWTCTADCIKSLFEKHGTVIDVELSMYNKSRNRGLAFVTMSSEEEALAALNGLNSYDLDGRVIKVEFARSLKMNPPPATSTPVPRYNVFVGNLTWSVRSHDLRELFNGNEGVLSAEVIYKSNPRKSAGYGFVSFASKEAAAAAITAMNGKRLMGRPIRLVLGRVQSGNAEAMPSVNEQQGDKEQIN